MERIRYGFDGRGVIWADSRAIAHDNPHNLTSGQDVGRMVRRANVAHVLYVAARAALAALPDYPPHDPMCSVTDVLREAIAKAKDL